MKTVVTERIESSTKALQLGYWNDESEEFVLIGDSNVEEAAAYVECSPRLLGLLKTMFELVATDVHSDLKDIWKRLDDIEARF